jgi:hypothetical protein
MRLSRVSVNSCLRFSHNGMPNNRSRNKTTAPKAKNKVGSVVTRSIEDIEPTSDEFDLSEEEDSSASLPRIAATKGSAAVNYSSDSSSTTRQALPRVLLETLVSDIQSLGGISVFRIATTDSQVVASLCDTRQDLYGKRADPLRAKIRKKIWKWHQDFKQDPKSWVEVLKKFNCTEKAAKVDPKLCFTKEPAAETDKKPAAVAVAPVQPPPVPKQVCTEMSNPQVRTDPMDPGKYSSVMFAACCCLGDSIN